MIAGRLSSVHKRKSGELKDFKHNYSCNRSLRSSHKRYRPLRDDRIAWFDQYLKTRYIDIGFWLNYKLQQTFLAISRMHYIVAHGDFMLGRSSLANRISGAPDGKRIRCHIRATIGRNTLHTCKCIFTHLRYNANTRRDRWLYRWSIKKKVVQNVYFPNIFKNHRNRRRLRSRNLNLYARY